MSDWTDYCRKHLCPICGNEKWCGHSGDVVRCMRVSDPPHGWRMVKRCDDGGVVFRRNESTPPNEVTDAASPGGSSSSGKPWSERAEAYVNAVTPERLRQLSCQLGTSVEALVAIGVGWQEERGRFTFPEYDASECIVGIGTRAPDGSKSFLRGGKRGLTLPRDWRGGAKPVLVVEGPSDVAAALTLGLNAVGRPSNKAGFAALAALLEKHDLLVVGENDQKTDGRCPGREGAEAIAQRLANRWRRPVRLAMPPEGSKDVRSWQNAQSIDPDDAEALALAGRGLLRKLEDNAETVDPDDVILPESCYSSTPTGLVYEKPSGDGIKHIPLSNFNARIVADVTRDDGVERLHFFDIEVELDGKTSRFAVSASGFANMSWVVEHLGARALLYPGQSIKEHTRAAIQILSSGIEERRIFAHTGWREIDSRSVYLHGDGAIGAGGLLRDVHTELSGPLTPFRLPSPPSDDALRDAVRSSLHFLDLGPISITAPLLAAVYRSVLAPSDFLVHLCGPTGTFKTELAALAQQHFGAGFDARNLPGSWSSTDNQLEMLAFGGKDALLVVDDFAPVGTPTDAARLHQKADRIGRAQGNRSGRGRLTRDGNLRCVKPPRGLILSTGEDIPRGHSLRARTLILEVGPTHIKQDLLTELQAAAVAGQPAAAMAAFLKHLAPRLEAIQGELKNAVVEGRHAGSGATHRRTPEILSNLRFGIGLFLKFARDVGAISEGEHDELLRKALSGLEAAAASQASHAASADPVDRFFELLRSALVSGQAHITSIDGSRPELPDLQGLGWRLQEGTRSADCFGEWRPLGDRIGWTKGDIVLLDPAASYRAAQKMAGPNGEGVVVGEKTLWKRMLERGLLTATEGDRQTLKRIVGEGRRRVLVLKLATVVAPESGQSGHTLRNGCPGPANEDPCPDSRPDSLSVESGIGAEKGAFPSPNGRSAPDAPIAPISHRVDTLLKPEVAVQSNASLLVSDAQPLGEDEWSDPL